MITIDDNERARLSRLTDSDGKIVITADMPEDLQAAIRYLNENNVNLLSASNPEAYVDDYEADPFAPGYVDVDDSSDEVSEEDDDDYDDDESNSGDSIDDLQEMF